jgi:clan AA aspartic protease
MGHAYATIRLFNPRKPKLKPVEARALADTGAATLVLPEEVAAQLQLETAETRIAHTADGRAVTVPYVGPVDVRFENRRCFVGALVMGDEVLLGAVPMEDMDLIVSPLRESVTTHPASPNVPQHKVK